MDKETALLIKKPKYKTHTPITIALSAQQIEMLAKVPRSSLKLLSTGKATKVEWYNVCFRVKVGHNLAVKLYTQEAVEALEEALELLLTVNDVHTATGLFTMSEDAILCLENALDYTDQMCKENTRRELLEAFQEVNKTIKQVR